MNSPTLDLRKVESFGGIDADTDQLLDECFEDHEAFRSVRGHERYLILGRKGSGKTAIFRKLLRLHSHDVFSFGHTFSDYPWHYHTKQKNTGVPVEQCFIHSWEYLIYLTVAKILLNMDHSQPKPYPSASGATKCGSRGDGFVLEQITNITRFRWPR